MPRYLTRGVQIALDLIAMSIAFWLAFSFRFEFSIPNDYQHTALLHWPLVLALHYLGLVAMSVPRLSWRYVSIREVLRVWMAVLLGTSLLIAMRAAVGARISWLDPIPLGVVSMNFVLCFVALTGIRVVRRLYAEAMDRRRRAVGRKRTRVLLIGAGQAGVLVAREIASRPDLGLHAVGFLDDDRLKVGTHIGGLPVLGTTAELEEIVEMKRVERALITIANASGAQVRRITVACRDAGLETKIIPGIYEIVGERVNLSRIREVAIEDLLGRDPIQLDEAGLLAAIRGEVVMVTGAGGSIGSELCRQVCRYAPSRLVLVERFENALFEIHRELRARFPEVEIEPRVADVCDTTRMTQLFEEHRPQTVIHAAAHKHVPMMEANPGEALKNNVGGTRLVAELADRFGAVRFVLVSTDKAVNPTSIMGATKRVAEIYVQALGQRSRTRFVTVRFGNVLGSNGSVIPIFKEQIARGGPITVTHPDMKRYFMTIPEASQLVLQAGSMGEGGEIFILDMGEPVRIVDLARDLITLSGLRPDEDIAIEYSGVRPGEKLFEELSTNAEDTTRTKHPKIFIGRIAPTSLPDVARKIDELLAMADRADADRIRNALRGLVPEYNGGEAKPRRDTTGSRPLVAV